jgi:hypothetical protein
MRFIEWTDVPITLQALRMYDLELDRELDRGVRWFRPTLQTIVDAATRIVELCDNPVREAKIGRQGPDAYPIKRVHLEFDAPQFEREGRPFFDAFLALARGIATSRPTHTRHCAVMSAAP